MDACITSSPIPQAATSRAGVHERLLALPTAIRALDSLVRDARFADLLLGELRLTPLLERCIQAIIAGGLGEAVKGEDVPDPVLVRWAASRIAGLHAQLPYHAFQVPALHAYLGMQEEEEEGMYADFVAEYRQALSTGYQALGALPLPLPLVGRVFDLPPSLSPRTFAHMLNQGARAHMQDAADAPGEQALPDRRQEVQALTQLMRHLVHVARSLGVGSPPSSSSARPGGP